MKLEDEIVVNEESGYKPILDFIKQYSKLNTFAIFGCGDEKVVFVEDGACATAVDAQSAKIMEYLESWSRDTFNLLPRDYEEFLISIEDEPYEGGMHIQIKAIGNDFQTTLDELPLNCN